MTKMKKLDRRVELRKHPNHENSCDGQYRPEFGALLLVGKKDFHDVRGKGQSLCCRDFGSRSVWTTCAERGI